MSWIRLNSDLPGSPRILQLARALKTNEVYALGAAATWFCWLDKNSEDGTTGLTPKELDAMALHCKGLAHALLENGWAVLDAQGFVCAVDFSQYNGESAKKRALTARRVAKNRANATQDALHDAGFCNAASVTDALPREDNIFNKGASKATVCSERGAKGAAQAPPAPAPFNRDLFCRWMDALCPVHPSLRQVRRVNGEWVLAQDVLDEAVAAFNAFPDAAQHAEMLAAFYAAKVDYIGDKERFHRPTGQRWFFKDLADVVGHAKAWARFSGWKPAWAKSKRPQGAGARAENKTPEENEQDPMEVWKEINEEQEEKGGER